MTLRGLICAVAGLAFLPGVATHARTVVVQPVPGDPAASGALLLAALADLEGTAVDPGLLKLEAGVYDIGFKTLFTKPYVDIEGSGEGVTTITGKSPRDDVPNPTVRMRTSTELRFLTIEDRGPGGATAISLSAGSPRLMHVTLRASNGRYNFVVDTVPGSTSSLTDVTIVASGPDSLGLGVATNSVVLMKDSTIVASGPTSARGTQNIGGSLSLVNTLVQTRFAVVGGVRADRSSIEGTQLALQSMSQPVEIGASQVIGAISGTTITCVGAYDGSYAPLDETCR